MNSFDSLWTQVWKKKVSSTGATVLVREDGLGIAFGTRGGAEGTLPEEACAKVRALAARQPDCSTTCHYVLAAGGIGGYTVLVRRDGSACAFGSPAPPLA